MSIPKIAPYAPPAPAAWPPARVGWRLSATRAALLIHDMQDYFVDFFDRDAEPVAAVVAHIARLRQCCRDAGVPVFYTAQPGTQPLAERALLQDWWGAGITAQPDRAGVIEALRPAEGDTVLDKWRYSAFAKSPFEHMLREQGRDQLIVCGVYAHIGVMTTCVDAFMRDVQPFLVADAVADFSRESHQMALDWVGGRCGVVLGTEAVCASLAPRRASAAGLYGNVQGLLADVAALLEIPASDLHPDDNLVDMGLDSIRLMSLVTRWRQAGCELAFVRLAERPTVQAWWALLNAPRANEPDRTARP